MSMDRDSGDPKSVQDHDRVCMEVSGGFTRKEEMVSGYLNESDYFGAVVIVCEGGVDGYPNVDELGDFCYRERGCQ
jgi:hypothetical protein